MSRSPARPTRLRRLACALAAMLIAASSARAHEPILTDAGAQRPVERMRCTIENAEDGEGLAVALVGASLEFVLRMRASAVTTPGARAERITAAGRVETSNATNTYRGVVDGVEASRVALTIDGNTVDGLARAGAEVFLFVPVDGEDCEVDAFRLSALGADPAADDALGHMLEGDTPFVLEYAVVGDHEWFQRWGAGSTSRMQSVVDAADVIYIDQMNLTLEVSHSEVFETAGDPFSEFDSGNLFANFRDATTEFGQWRDGEGGAVEAAGLAHLFSDKALGLTSGGAGFGFIDTLCDNDRGVSLSTTRFFNSIAFSALILAHEIGHNFGAPHDGEGACSNAPGGFIMAAAATGSQFSDCSKDIMTGNAEGASCIMEGPAVACAQPVSTGASPSATDCLFILSAAVGLSTCDPECVCAPGGSLPVAATDALLCLQVAVGLGGTLNCPC